MSKKIVEFDHKTNSVLVNLPPEHNEYRDAVMAGLAEAFAYEAITVPVVEQMNNFVIQWFKEKDINL